MPRRPRRTPGLFRTYTLQVRVNGEAGDLLTKAARLAQKPLSTFVREAALERASRMLRRHDEAAAADAKGA